MWLWQQQNNSGNSKKQQPLKNAKQMDNTCHCEMYLAAFQEGKRQERPLNSI